MSVFEWLFLMFSAMFIIWRVYLLAYIRGRRDAFSWFENTQRKLLLRRDTLMRKHFLSEN
jgi:hypothetical protein